MSHVGQATVVGVVEVFAAKTQEIERLPLLGGLSLPANIEFFELDGDIVLSVADMTGKVVYAAAVNVGDLMDMQAQYC